ncbi:ClpXP protease specificity-enhancing factor SspB [uncultured Roseobacter sp.]|uniref:SspB family protein n=1 Tax=uncultured Roseobacter sp. TaxID=114847 RepID=UPI0026184618|nr:ClpXP protease specificity-enhancing factor SspB [uncultured Roseobacter sp.]
MSRSIDYGNLMHEAMRGLIQKVLRDVSENGLPGAHHFFITFDTSHPDAELADWLSDRYPGEMTVVMQHWYDNLDVGDDGFSVTLNFGDAPEPLFIPYDAIKTFVDPSVEFGLRFETQEDEDENIGPTDLVPTTTASVPAVQPASKTRTHDAEESSEDDAKDAEIVSLDSFRK